MRTSQNRAFAAAGSNFSYAQILLKNSSTFKSPQKFGTLFFLGVLYQTSFAK